MNKADIDKKISTLPTVFPTLGDPTKTFTLLLSEPEICVIFAFYGFVRGAAHERDMRGSFKDYLDRYWKHYGAVVDSVNERLQKLEVAALYDIPGSPAQ